jgi:pimeloyl-ACP methyl ester carboxylesterase
LAGAPTSRDQSETPENLVDWRPGTNLTCGGGAVQSDVVEEAVRPCAFTVQFQMNELMRARHRQLRAHLRKPAWCGSGRGTGGTIRRSPYPSPAKWACELLRPGVELMAALATVCLLSAGSQAASPPAAQSGASTNSLATSANARLAEGHAGYKYLALRPKTAPTGQAKLPLIIFLHGVCPNEDLEKFKHFSPLKYGLDHEGFPFLVVCPATSRGWSVPTLNQLLDHLQTNYPVDPDRIYVTGHSMGGHATWAWALAQPSRFAAIAPAAGAGNPQEAARRLRHLPVWIFHGAKDNVVPVTFGEVMARALKSAGGEVKTTIYPDLGHDTWDPPYKNAELYGWFLQHRRGGSAPIRPDQSKSPTPSAGSSPATKATNHAPPASTAPATQE